MCQQLPNGKRVDRANKNTTMDPPFASDRARPSVSWRCCQSSSFRP